MRRLQITTLTLMLTMAVLAWGASAEEDVPTTTWYMHNLDGPTGDATYLDHEPPVGEEVQTATSEDPTATTIYSEAEAPLEALLETTGGASEAFLFVKSWNNAPAPQTAVTVTVFADDDVVATGSLTQDVMLGEVVEYRIPLDLEIDALDAGTTVAWEVEISTEGINNPFAYPYGVSEEHSWGFHLALAEPEEEDDEESSEEELTVEMEEDVLSLAFDEPTNDTYIYTWSTDLEDVQVTGPLSVSEGTVQVTIEDAEGVLYDEEVAGDLELDEAFEGAAAGDWTITLAFTGFVGSVDLAFEALEIPEDEQNPNATDAPDIDEKEDETDPDAVADDDPGVDAAASTEESPGVGLLALLALMGVGLIAFRRTRE